MASKSDKNSDKNNIAVERLFAIPVYRVMLNNFEPHREPLIKLIQAHRKKSPGIHRSNANAWHSENNLHHWDNDHVRWLNKEIGEVSMACLTNYGNLPKKFNLVLHSAWANICGLGGWNVPHNHIPNHWSGAVYLDVEDPEDDPKKRDKNDKSGMIEFLNPIQHGSFFGLPTGVSYRPKNGQIFLFHSALTHLVHPHFTKFERISIAFNLNIDEQ